MLPTVLLINVYDESMIRMQAVQTRRGLELNEEKNRGGCDKNERTVRIVCGTELKKCKNWKKETMKLDQGSKMDY